MSELLSTAIRPFFLSIFSSIQLNLKIYFGVKTIKSFAELSTADFVNGKTGVLPFAQNSN
jgi:hypothetical protein